MQADNTGRFVWIEVSTEIPLGIIFYNRLENEYKYQNIFLTLDFLLAEKRRSVRKGRCWLSKEVISIPVPGDSIQEQELYRELQSTG